ncbi:MAG: M56 family metallopeptidase [Acidobacteriota bacterium]
MVWWLTQHLATVAVLAAAVQVTTRLLRAGPGLRHLLWTIVLIKLVLPPVLAWPWALESGPVGWSPGPSGPGTALDLKAQGSTVDRGVQGSEGGSQTLDPTLQGSTEILTTSVATKLNAFDWRAVAGLLWIAGSCLFGCVHAVRAWRMRQLMRGARAVGDELSHQLQSVAVRMDVRPVPIRLAALASPVVWGGLRPVILWPETLPESIHTQAIDGLLTHELAHVKRHDHWIGWLDLAAGCAWWWNPLFWHVRQQLRANAELACDAWVAKLAPRDRRHYAEALLAFSAGYSSLRTPIPAIGVRSGNRRLMERRLAMIMRAHVPVRLSRLALCTSVLVAAIAFPAWAQRPTSPAVLPTPPQSPRPTPSMAQQPAPRPTARGATTARPPSVPAEQTILVYTPARPVAVEGRSIASAPVVVETQAAGPTFQGTLRYTEVSVRQVDGDLPAEAQVLVRKFGETTAQKRREAEDAIARERTALVEQLQKLQDAETKAGHLDPALAIRSRIRQLQRGAMEQYSSGRRVVISPVESGFAEDGFATPPPPPPGPPAPRRPARPPTPPPAPSAPPRP